MAYFLFNVHDRYEGSTRYEVDTLFRMFVLKELHGWEHQTSLVDYLRNAPVVCDQLGLETVPDQSTLWRSWNTRFTADLRETVETTARTLFIEA
nr:MULTISPECIES: transposase [Halorubrum]